jgi:hypothetical protein
MPLQSVRPDILRSWKDDVLAWDGDPSTVDALLLRLEQIAVGHGVSLDHYRQAANPDADWQADREVGQKPDLTSVRERIRDARDQWDR